MLSLLISSSDTSISPEMSLGRRRSRVWRRLAFFSNIIIIESSKGITESLNRLINELGGITTGIIASARSQVAYGIVLPVE